MGHFGAQTGYPVLRVTVTNAAGMTGDGNRDYLVMGTAEDQPALKTLDASLPVGVDVSGLEIHNATGFFDRTPWWRLGASRTQDHAGFGELVSGGLPDALIEGMEWPAGSRRSVVVLVLRDSASIPDPPCSLSEDLAVGRHFPVGQRTARDAIHFLSDWRRPLPGGRDLAAGTRRENSAGAALAGCGGDGADVLPDGSPGPGMVAASRPNPAPGHGVAKILTPSPGQEARAREQAGDANPGISGCCLDILRGVR